MKLLFLALVALTSEAAKFVPSHLADPFDDGTDHDIDTDPNYYEEDEEEVILAEESSTDVNEDEPVDAEKSVTDEWDLETAEAPVELAEGEDQENEKETAEAPVELAEEEDQENHKDGSQEEPEENLEASLLQEEADDDMELGDEDDADEATTTEIPSGDAADTALIQEVEEADHDDDAAEDAEDAAEDAESLDVDADDAMATTESPSADPPAFIQMDEADEEVEEEEVEEEEVDELTAKLNEENTVQDSASLLQEGEGSGIVPPEREYIGSLADPKAHPYVYKKRKHARAACQQLGYRGLCTKDQVKGWSKCAYGFMEDYKGYWFRKTKRGCGRGKGFRNGKKVKKMGAYCCNLASNSQYIGSLKKPDAHPYVYKSRSNAEKACQKAGYRGLCSKAQITGYAKCAAGWLSDSKGYWFDRTHRGCGKGRGFRPWGKGKVGAYCCAPTVNNIQYIGSLTDTTAHPYVYRKRNDAKKACRAAGYHGLCSKAQATGFSRCKAGWYSDYKGYWMHEGRKGCGRGRGWRSWGKSKVGAYCCNLASNAKYIGSLTNPKKHPYVYSKKSDAEKACDTAGYRRLCRKFEIEGYAKCAAGWLADFKGYWYDRNRKGCSSKGAGYHGWGKGKVGAYCCQPKQNVKYIGNLKQPKKHPYVYKTRGAAEKSCVTAGYRRLCYRSEIEFVGKCKAGWLKDFKGYWFPKSKKGCGSGTGYRSWGKGKVGAYCCEKVKLPLCHEDQLSVAKGVWRCDDYSGSTGQEAKCVEKYQQIKAESETMHFKCVASPAGGGKFNCLAGDKCQPIFPRGTPA